jgi:hypothetical protein
VSPYDCSLGVFDGKNIPSKIVMAESPVQAALVYLSRIDLKPESRKAIGNSAFELRVFPRTSAFGIGDGQ